MTATSPKPIIFLAFANDIGNGQKYLRNLGREAENLQNVLDFAERSKLCIVRARQNITIASVLNFFQDERYRNHVTVFHFGGHANDYQLLMQTATGEVAIADAKSFAEFLGQQTGLELVFLNACSTQQHVHALLDAGVSMVIATSQAIDDEIATNFSTRFYTGLAGGATIQMAFDEAVAGTKMEYGNRVWRSPRHLISTEQTDEGQHQTKSGPWALYSRSGAEITAQWNLPDTANDPLFGLPKLVNRDLPDSPYRHLHWFHQDHAEIFFGRGHKIRDLYQRVIAPNGAPLILFYGQSGVGKSSLLAAGLLPRLEQSHCIYYVRRDQTQGLLGTLNTVFTNAAAISESADLAQAWLARENQTGKPLIIILDQVEEFYTRPNPALPDEMAQFLVALQTTFSDLARRPQGRLILGFRKEWLAEIEKYFIEAKLSKAKVFLDRLDHDGIVEVVSGPASDPRLKQHYGLSVEEGLPTQIADDLLEDRGAAIAPTLQILLSKLWERAKQRDYDHPLIDRKLYEELRKEGLLLKDFLDQQLTALGKEYTTVAETGLALDLLAFHTTLLGTAEQRTLAILRTTYQHQMHMLDDLVRKCQDLYLLVDPVQNQPDAESSTRLAHDTLAPLVRARFDTSDAPGQRARRTLENRALDWLDGKTGAPLDDYDLALVESGEAGMRAWQEHEQTLVKESRTARQKRIEAQAAAERRQQEAEQQRKAAEQEVVRQKQRTRQRLTAAIAIAASVILVTAIGFSIWVLFEQSKTFTEAQETLRNESRLLAARAVEQMNVDPIASLRLSLAALPSPDHPRPYVPSAEFALIRALQTSMEREYRFFGETALTPGRVALAPDHATVMVAAVDGVWQVASDLAQPPLQQEATPMKAVMWSDGRPLLSYSDRMAYVWLDNKPPVSTSTTEDISCAAWRPHYEQVALCTRNAIYLWSYQTATPQPLQGITVTNTLRSIAWSPAGTHLAAAFDQEPVQLWAVDNVAARDALTVGADIGEVAFVDDERFITWSFANNRTQLWQIDGRLLFTYTVETELIQGFTLSPDHSQLLLYLNSGDMQLVKLETGEAIGRRLRGHEGVARAAAWHPSRNYLATSARDGTARIWDLTNNENVVTLRGHVASSSLDRIDVYGVYWQDDTHLLTYGEDGTLRRWQVFGDDGMPLCMAGSDRDGYPRCFNFSTAVDIGTGETVAADWLTSQTILAVRNELVDTTAQQFTFDRIAVSLTHAITNEAGLYPQMIWSPDGQSVLTYQLESEVRSDAANRYEWDGIIRDGKTGDRVRQLRGPIAQAFWLAPGALVDADTGAPESAILISRESGESILFHSQTLQRVATITGHRHKIRAASVYTPTQRLATADKDGVVQVWDLHQNQQLLLQGTALSVDKQLPLNELVWNGDGSKLLAAGRTITLWDVENNRQLWQISDVSQDTSHVAFSPDEAYVAIAVDNAFFVVQADDPNKRLWERFDAHTDPIKGVRWLTGAPWPHQLADDWFSRLLARLNGTYQSLHQERLLLLTWSGDGTARLWDWQNRTEVARFADIGSLNLALFDRTEAYLLTAGNLKTLRIWQSWHQDPTALLAAAQNRLTRELTVEQLQQFALPTPTATLEPRQ